MKLKSITKLGPHPEWCGPSALSALTGRSINHCAKLIAKNRNVWKGWYNGKGTSKQVKGVEHDEMQIALHAMKFSMTPVKMPLKHHKHQVYAVNQAAFMPLTLRAYMAGRGGEQWKGSMLLNIGNHYVTVHKDIVSDNHATCHYSEHPHRLKRIVKGWIVKPRKKR